MNHKFLLDTVKYWYNILLCEEFFEFTVKIQDVFVEILYATKLLLVQKSL